MKNEKLKIGIFPIFITGQLNDVRSWLVELRTRAMQFVDIFIMRCTIINALKQ